MRRSLGVVEFESDIAGRVQRRGGARRLGAQTCGSAKQQGAAGIERPIPLV